jgi:hypothetical protein
MEQDTIVSLLPLALGHDQEASGCPWVALTGQTPDYPSRKAQAAIAVANGVIPATSDIIDLLYRCDHCGHCQAASTLPDPPDLARALWNVRASLINAGTVPEVNELAAQFRSHGSLFGDLGKAFQRLGRGDSGAEILFVPGASTLALAPEAAKASLQLLRAADAHVEIRPDLLDSGQELRELGFVVQPDRVQQEIRLRVAEANYQLVIAGTPKEAIGLREALADQRVEVCYAGEYVAERVGILPRPLTTLVAPVFFHPSETLLHQLDGFETIDRMLSCWLGDRYRREPEPRRNAWPAAIERPSPRVPDELSHGLAKQRLSQIVAAVWNDGEQLTILTCDPFSLRALQRVAPPYVEVVDLLVFASRLLGKEGAIGG